jgi:hypothetical protein
MAAQTGCMLGWYDQNGYSTTNGLEDMETTLGTRFACVRVYNQWWPNLSSTVATATNDGRLVLSSHKPPNHGGAWIEIARGDHDSEITAMVNFYKGLAPKEVIFIFHHEPHDQASENGGTSGRGADFVAAFRRIAGAFRTAGADNVRIGYCAVANYWACRGSPVGTGDQLYPGDDVVDVLCHDDYNWSEPDIGPSASYSPNPSKWHSMQTVMQNSVALAKRLKKPLIWGELGSQHGAAGNTRDTWFRDGAAYLKTGDAANYVLGFCYYHVDNHKDAKHPNGTGNWWRFAQGRFTDGKQGYIDALTGDSYFLTKPIPVSLRKTPPPSSATPPTSVQAGGGIPSNLGFGTAAVTMAGAITITSAGAITAPSDYQDPEQSPGLDFGTATVTLGALPDYGGIFVPPTEDVVPAVLPTTGGVQRRLFRHYGANPRGITVILKTDGSTVEVRVPVEMVDSIGNIPRGQIARVFTGGHIHQVDSDEISHLVAAGYSGNITYPTWGTPMTWIRMPSWADLSISTWGDI